MFYLRYPPVDRDHTFVIELRTSACANLSRESSAPYRAAAWIRSPVDERVRARSAFEQRVDQCPIDVPRAAGYEQSIRTMPLEIYSVTPFASAKWRSRYDSRSN
jgi:hypothetical protein